MEDSIKVLEAILDDRGRLASLVLEQEDHGRKEVAVVEKYEPLVLDGVYTYNELSNDDRDWYEDPHPGVDQIVADTNRALPRGEVGWEVATQSDGGNDGIYVVTSLGENGVSPWVLTRHPDYNTVEKLHRPMSFLVGKNTDNPDGVDGWAGVATVSVDYAVVQTLDPIFRSYAIFITYAEGNYSHAEGNASHAKGYSSHAEGYGSRAEGYTSHAENNYSYAKGHHSHAEGYYGHAEGNASHAEGENSQAKGEASHAEGRYSIARAPYSHARGGGKFSEDGDCQYTSTELQAITSNATPTPLSAFSFNTELVVAPNRVVGVRAMVAARKSDGTLGSAWLVTAAVRIGADGAVTTLGTPTVTLLGQDAGASSWGVAFSTAAGSTIRVLVTGAAGTTIHWSGTIETKEVG